MERTKAVPAWWTRPVWVGLLGLGLMVGGWKLGTLAVSPFPGRLLFVAGVVLFAGAGVAMYRQPAPVEDDEAAGASAEGENPG